MLLIKVFRKTLIAFCLLSFIVGKIQAQRRTCIHAGILGSDVKWTYSDREIGNGRTKGGFKAGFLFNIPVDLNVLFMPELNIILKGTKVSSKETSSPTSGIFYTSDIKTTINAFFIEVPINLGFTFPADKSAVIVGGGPVLNFGLGGKVKEDVKVYTNAPDPINQDRITKTKIKFDGLAFSERPNGDENFHLNRIELGANIFFAYELNKKYIIRAFYNLGLTNLEPNENVKFKTSHFGIGFGYYLKSKK